MSIYLRILLITSAIGTVYFGLYSLYGYIYENGYKDAREEVLLANAEVQEAAYQQYLEEFERGQQLSIQLSKSQKRLAHVQQQNALYSANIIGTCPDKLRLLVTYAARGESPPVSETPSTSTGETGTVAADVTDAKPIADNIAVNYARCLANIDQLNALIDFYENTK
jgi:hypothetical protein